MEFRASSIKVRLHEPSKSPFFVPFKNGFNAALLYCLHITLEIKGAVNKTVTLTVSVNRLVLSKQ